MTEVKNLVKPNTTPPAPSEVTVFSNSSVSQVQNGDYQPTGHMLFKVEGITPVFTGEGSSTEVVLGNALKAIKGTPIDPQAVIEALQAHGERNNTNWRITPADPGTAMMAPLATDRPDDVRYSQVGEFTVVDYYKATSPQSMSKLLASSSEPNTQQTAIQRVSQGEVNMAIDKAMQGMQLQAFSGIRFVNRSEEKAIPAITGEDILAFNSQILDQQQLETGLDQSAPEQASRDQTAAFASFILGGPLSINR